MVELCVDTRKGIRKSFLFNTKEQAEEVKEKLINLGYRIIYLKCLG